MLKYVPGMTNVVLEEIPDKVTLAVEISNCQGNCVGCHSPFLRNDIGEELTHEAIDRLIADNFGINCFLLLGEGNDQEAVLEIASYLKEKYPRFERAIYSGRSKVEDILFEAFDYVKTGPYIEEFGPLNSITTNQRLYYHGADVTSRFWHRKLEDRKEQTTTK